jgi:hypothetical protein
LPARLVVLLLALLSALALAAPATAPAADADVQAAWTSEAAALKTAETKLASAVKAAQRTKFRRVGSAVTAIKAVERLTATVRSRVVGTGTSTPSGAKAREAILKSLTGFSGSLKNLRLALQAANRKKLALAQRLLARSLLLSDGASDDAADARTYFEAARREAEEQRRQQEQQPPPPDGGGSGGTEPPPPPPQPTCAENPSQEGCPLFCAVDPQAEQCQKPPGAVVFAARRFAALV